MSQQKLQVARRVHRQFLHGFTEQTGLGIALDDDNLVALLVSDQQEFATWIEAELTRVITLNRTLLQLFELRGRRIDAEHHS